MKKIIALSIVILGFSCAKENSNYYTITGTVEGIEDSTLVKLQRLVNNRPNPIDTAYVTNETFQFKGTIDTTEMYFINIKNVSGNLPVILESGDIDIYVDKTNLNNSNISGTKENELLKEYTNVLMNASKSNKIFNAKFKDAQEKKDEEKMAAVRKSYDSFQNAKTEFELKFAKENNTSLVSALVVERLIFSKYKDIKALKAIYDTYPKHIQDSRPGKNINKDLTAMLATAEGEIAPTFEGPNPEGKLIALKDITSANKVTIVDFWAAWCGPCRKENPNLVKLYTEYKDKGLEIVGVSLDGSSRQKEPKAAWLKAIEDDGLTWKQISNLKYFQDPIALAYNIRSIPATFVLDTEGRIIGKGLRGQALKNKIAELLN